MRQKRFPTIQPAHKSDRISVEQAMQGWLRIRARRRAGTLDEIALPPVPRDPQPRVHPGQADR